VTANPRYADAFNNLGIVLAGEGKFDEAIASHKAGLAVRNDRASDHNNLSRVYLKRRDREVEQGETDKAKADLDNALEQLLIAQRCDPNFLPAWLTWTEIYIKQKSVDAAAKCVQGMIAIDRKSPTTLQAQYQLAKYYLDLARPDDAIAGLTAMLEIDKSTPEVYDARGTAYVKKGDLQHALEDFEQILRLAPQYPGVQERIRYVRERLGNPKK
jgi:tetratricopeptide (TPR) repeat protein